MRIVVDRRRCEGHGLCEGVAPRLLSADEGRAELLVEGDLPVDQEAAATAAVRVCPIAALRTA
uniref:Putative ferredoxin n=1 Tax=Streptomyces griseoloalbus TaxID=67303 RepID=D1H0A5_9ACTN|nr:putative ferredoxin [Streptomyces albaduncus]